MSGMEAIGAIASASQLVGYLVSLISTLKEIQELPQRTYRFESYKSQIASLPAFYHAASGSSTTRSRSKSKREWNVPVLLDGHPVNALPDTGSQLDIVSDHFVSTRGLQIDTKKAQAIRLPDSRTVQSMGTVAFPLRFFKETTSFPRVFHVVRNCLHDCILGNEFLKSTATLTKHYARRVKETVVNLSAPMRLRLLGVPQERVLGSVNGHAVGAYADTGADVMVISSRFAKQASMRISTGKLHEKELKFADGSTTRTVGMVYGAKWRFGTGEASVPYTCDFHVLEDLPCDIILSNEFYSTTTSSPHTKPFSTRSTAMIFPGSHPSKRCDDGGGDTRNTARRLQSLTTNSNKNSTTKARSKTEFQHCHSRNRVLREEVNAAE